MMTRNLKRAPIIKAIHQKELTPGLVVVVGPDLVGFVGPGTEIVDGKSEDGVEYFVQIRFFASLPTVKMPCGWTGTF